MPNSLHAHTHSHTQNAKMRTCGTGAILAGTLFKEVTLEQSLKGCESVSSVRSCDGVPGKENSNGKGRDEGKSLAHSALCAWEAEGKERREGGVVKGGPPGHKINY